MTITRIEDLRTWFMNNQRAGELSPHWNLYSLDYSKNDVRTTFYDRSDNMEDSFDFLVTSLRMLNNPDGSKFRVMQFPSKKANNPTGIVNVQIHNHTQQQQVAGIAGIGHLDGYIGKQEVTDMISAAKEKWEMEHRIAALEEQLSAPANDWTEKLMAGLERISGTPFGQVIAAKMLGLAPGAALPFPMPQAVNGTPETDDEPGDNFDEDIEATAKMLGVSDAQLAAKMRALVTANPEMARSLLQ